MTNTAKPRSSEPTIDDAARLIKKIEACEGMPAKLILLRNFAERYAATLREHEFIQDIDSDTCVRPDCGRLENDPIHKVSE